MAVVTISRELGSGGTEIARQVAEALGYAFVDKNTTDGVFRQYGLTKFDDLYSSAPSILDLLNMDNLLLISMANEILEAVAQRGNVVILGRAGFAVLADCADVLKVRIQAPFSERVQRAMEREGTTDLDAVMARVKEDDEIHSKYMQRFYNKRWDDPANFDLTVSTSSASYDAAVQQIVTAARALEQKALVSEAVTAAKLKVDPVLADAVAKVMAYPLPRVSEQP